MNHHQMELNSRSQQFTIIQWKTWTDTGSSYELDFAMAHPWCPGVLSRAANEDGAAVLRAEKRKHSKYSTEILPEGYISECIPLVFEHFGRWGWEAQKFFVNISKSSVDEDAWKAQLHRIQDLLETTIIHRTSTMQCASHH